MLASGLPLVASSVHGIKDYVKDGVNGYLANPYDARSFARGIEKLFDPAARAGMKDACHDSVKSYDVSITRKQLAGIYDAMFPNEGFLLMGDD